MNIIYIGIWFYSHNSIFKGTFQHYFDSDYSLLLNASEILLEYNFNGVSMAIKVAITQRAVDAEGRMKLRLPALLCGWVFDYWSTPTPVEEGRRRRNRRRRATTSSFDL